MNGIDFPILYSDNSVVETQEREKGNVKISDLILKRLLKIGELSETCDQPTDRRDEIQGPDAN
ncbi:hypothetical protein GCM10027347_03070 [Larkinella harenae]